MDSGKRSLDVVVVGCGAAGLSAAVAAAEGGAEQVLRTTRPARRGLGLAALGAQAQGYPSRTITLIVPHSTSALGALDGDFRFPALMQLCADPPQAR